MTTRVMSDDNIVNYAETRLFGANVKPSDITSISLHNGVLPSRLEHILTAASGRNEIIQVQQKNGREPIFFVDGALHIPQYSGFARRLRYETMIQDYLTIKQSDTVFRSLETEGVPRKTNHAYDNFAYDFVKKLFETERMGEIRYVIFGPLDAVSKQSTVIKHRPDEYLPSQLIELGGKTVLNMGYVYSDQGGRLMSKILLEYDAIARNGRLDLGIFMFGRVGGLVAAMERHDLVYPTGFLDETDLASGKVFKHPLHNILADGGKFEGLNLNVGNVLKETMEQLTYAAANGAICVEMETHRTAEAINQGRRDHAGLKIDFGFVGHVSDRPLLSDPISIELDSDRGEQDAVAQIAGYIAAV